MKVAVSSPSPFHAYDLARELARRRELANVYAAYPADRIQGVPRDRVVTNLLLGGAHRAATRTRVLRRGADLWAMRRFDRWVSKRLEACDIFHFMSSFGVMSRARAESFGALCVCDRGSTHIVAQDRVLREEYEIWDIPYPGIDARVIDRELEEYRNSDFIFVPSTFARDSFLAEGVPPEQVRKVPYGVDLSRFGVSGAPRSGPFRVLFVGAVSIRKGIGYLLKAARHVGGRGLDIEFRLVGPVSPEARRLLERFPSDNVTCVGPVPRDEVAREFAAASVLAHPSVEEGLALVLLQALASGLPVIATPNSGIEDVIQDGREGFVIPVRDERALADRIEELHEDGRRRDEMARRTRETSVDGWTWQRYGDDVVAAYSEGVRDH